MKLLTFSTLYPNREQPTHGVFVERRLLELVRTGRVTARVVAPVPWFPFRSARFGQYATLARVPGSEERSGLTVHHPRYPLVPKLGMTVAPALMALAVLPLLRRLHAAAAFELIDAHYFYPDGVAAALLGRWLQVPVAITARGSDVNLIGGFAAQRRMILWAARRATAVIAVSQALRRALIELGCQPASVHVLRNGVDLESFRPMDAAAARERLGVQGRVLMSVGKLDENKGHHIVISALAELPEVSLLIAGEGPWRERLERQAQAAGVASRVRFLGNIAPEELCACYSAADALVLASSREGMPNVVLEALACGTPVVATRAGGTPEVLGSRAAGMLVDERSPGAFAAAIRTLLEGKWDRPAVRRHAEQFGWTKSVQGQLELFGAALAAAPRDRAAAA